MRRTPLLLFLILGCGSNAPTSPSPAPPPPPVPPPPPSFTVHEWGLVGGTPTDGLELHGPHADPPILPMAKPVLYVHLDEPRALSIEFEVSIRGGRLVEVWPRPPALRATPSDALGERIAWRVDALPESCTGLTYPTVDADVCSRILSGCEVSTLRTAESPDAACLAFEGARWNHLFYRADVSAPPPLPLDLRSEPGGRLQITPVGDARVAQVFRLARRNDDARAPEGFAAYDLSAEAQTLDLPAGPMTDGPAAIIRALTEAGLTEPEALAFGDAWFGEMFGAEVASTYLNARLPPIPHTTAVAETRAGGGRARVPASRSLLYVLPQSTVEAMASLRITPAPRETRRVLVAWVAEPAAPPGR